MHFQPIENVGDDTYLSHAGGGLPAVQNVNDTLDDIFGGDAEQPSENQHPSDMRRLETEHTTAGYREGIALGKEATLQKGFDEGYSVGAAIGLQAGTILGLLEGVAEAIKAKDEGSTTEAAEALLSDSKAELCVDKIFSAEYWMPTGEYGYAVSPGADLHAAALAHPLIKKWTKIMEEHIQLWNIDRTILEHLNPEPTASSQAPKEPEPQGEAETKDLLEW